MDAAGIIGSGGPGDYGLSPVEHAEQLRTSAPSMIILWLGSEHDRRQALFASARLMLPPGN